MRLLPDSILVEVDDIGPILDLRICLLGLVHPEHEWERRVSVAKVPIRQEGDIEIAHVLILEGEDEALEGFTAVDQLVAICADKHVAGLQEHALEHPHDVVHLETLEQDSNRLVVHVRQLIVARHAEADHFIPRCVVDG